MVIDVPKETRNNGNLVGMILTGVSERVKQSYTFWVKTKSDFFDKTFKKSEAR